MSQTLRESTQPLKPVLDQLLSKLKDPLHQKRAALVESWPQVIGNRFAKHTKPRLSADGKLTVWVDDSTLAFELSQRYKPVLLKRLGNQLGGEWIKEIRFFVGDID